MESVGATLGEHINVASGIATVGSVVLAGLYFEFLNGLRIRNAYAATKVAASLQVIDLDPIHLEVVVAGR